MKRVFILKGLDCPNCSAKIEKEVGELDGVTSSTVNLMNQTMTVQAGTSVATSLLDTVTTIVHSHEPDVEVSEKTEPAVTKVYLLKGLDCPNCSAKIEREVGELDGVTSSTVNLMNQTLTVQAGTSVAASLLDTVTTIVHSHEPYEQGLGQVRPNKITSKLARVADVKSRWSTTFSRIENLWPRDGSCPLPLRSKPFLALYRCAQNHFWVIVSEWLRRKNK